MVRKHSSKRVKQRQKKAVQSVQRFKNLTQTRIKFTKTDSKLAAQSKMQAIQALRGAAREALLAKNYNKLAMLDKLANIEVSEAARLRSNRVFMQQMALAAREQPSSLGSYGKVKTKIFYRATQKFWEGKKGQARNEAIMQALGVKSMAEAYKIVMALNLEALQMGMDADKTPATTAAPEFANAVLIDYMTSPDYIYMVNMLGF